MKYVIHIQSRDIKSRWICFVCQQPHVRWIIRGWFLLESSTVLDAAYYFHLISWWTLGLFSLGLDHSAATGGSLQLYKYSRALHLIRAAEERKLSSGDRRSRWLTVGARVGERDLDARSIRWTHASQRTRRSKIREIIKLVNSKLKSNVIFTNWTNEVNVYWK